VSLVPTARQNDELVHETEASKAGNKGLGACVGVGIGVIDQAVPSQTSPSCGGDPTAAQKVRLGHDTPERATPGEPGLGIGVTVQAAAG